MKIAFIGAFCGIGGIQRVAAYVASQIAKTDTVYYADYRGDGALVYEIGDAVVWKDVSTDANRGGRMSDGDQIYEKYAEEIVKLIRLLNEERIDIALLCGSFCTALLPKLKEAAPQCSFIGWQHSSYETYTGEYSQRYRDAYLRGAALADYLVALTDADAAKYRALNPRTLRIYNPFIPLAENPLRSEELNSLLFVGRIQIHTKGLDLLLAALDLIGRGDVTLDIVGDGADMEQFRELVKNRENIRMHGFLQGEALAQMYARASVLVCPSRYEGFALVLLEAMSFGLPIVATPFTCASEVVSEIASDFSAEAVADAIIRVLDDKALRARMSASAKARIAAFGITGITKQWRTLFAGISEGA